MYNDKYLQELQEQTRILEEIQARKDISVAWKIAKSTKKGKISFIIGQIIFWSLFCSVWIYGIISIYFFDKEKEKMQGIFTKNNKDFDKQFIEFRKNFDELSKDFDKEFNKIRKNSNESRQNFNKQFDKLSKDFDKQFRKNRTQKVKFSN